MSGKKPENRGLGRGLSALMADVASAEAGGGDERKIPVEKIRPNPNQPRRSFSPKQMEDLTQSIQEKGIIQPLILRAIAGSSDEYEIVAGERRWRAAQAAQLHDVPAVIRDFSDEEVLEVAIIENIQRADLNPIEEAAGYQELMNRFGHTQERVASGLGKSRSHVANLLRLLSLPDSVQNLLREGSLTAGHARTLVNAENAEALAKEIVKEGLSVRDAERLSKRGQTKKKPAVGTAKKPADTVEQEKELSAALGLKVKIDHRPETQDGQVNIRYSNLEEFDRLRGLLSRTA